MARLNKSGTELSLTVIIIAIILLVVLVVMVAIFTGKISIFGKTTTTCASKGGQCSEKISGGLTCPGGYATMPEKTDCQYSCCIPVG
jgi:hypothetical protein